MKGIVKFLIIVWIIAGLILGLTWYQKKHDADMAGREFTALMSYIIAQRDFKITLKGTTYFYKLDKTQNMEVSQ